MELPHEITEEILLRVPVKPLHRFRCVSKPWYSLISSPSFHTQHYRRQSQQNPLILVIRNEDRTGSIGFSTYNDEGDPLHHFSQTLPRDKFHIPLSEEPFCCIGFCFGLLCLRSFSTAILVCNPSTQQLIEVSPPFSEIPSFCCIGFGYAASTQEFKVVRFFHCNLRNICSCEIFTLGTTGGWREARRPPPFKSNRWGAPFAHRALHLITCGDHDHHKIVAFDIDTEQYRGIPLPDIYLDHLLVDNIGFEVFRGSLCLIFGSSYTEYYNLELWFLKDYNSGKWVKEYNINLSTVSYASPRAILGDGRILLRISCDEEDYKDYELGCYHPQEKCFRRNFLKQKINISCSTTLYVESFLDLGRLEQIGSSAAPLADLLLNPSDDTVQSQDCSN